MQQSYFLEILKEHNVSIYLSTPFALTEYLVCKGKHKSKKETLWLLVTFLLDGNPTGVFHPRREAVCMPAMRVSVQPAV